MCLASILLSCRCSTLYYSRMVDEDFSSAYLTETQTYHILQISQVTSQFLRVEVVCRWQSITATAVIIKKNQFNPFLCCERLSSQSQVDSFASVEEGRLTYIAEHQDDFRCEHFQGVADAVGQGHLDGSSIGKKRIVPTAFTGGDRYGQQNFQDGVAICRVFGPPHLFVTFTCNPKWAEIKDALVFEPGQKSTDRSDLVVRVFKLKMEQFMKGIMKGRTFGPVCAGSYSRHNSVMNNPIALEWLH